MRSRAVKEGVNNADLALARMRVVGTKIVYMGHVRNCVLNFR